MDANEKIIRLVMNREVRDFWGYRDMQSSAIGCWHDASHLKSLLKKGFDYVMKHNYDCLLVITDEFTYAFMTNASDRDNGTVTMTKKWNHQYSTDEPVTMNPALVRRTLYKMAEATGERRFEDTF